MFDIDSWQEIFGTIKKNKLRTFLTGFSVAWGIFMLIILLGSGKGFENGVKKQFAGDAVNSIWVYSGSTSMAYKGFKPGRRIRFTNNDYDETKLKVKQVEEISSRYGIGGNHSITYKEKYGAFNIVTVHPATKHIEKIQMKEGRFINEIDINKYRKITSISKIVKDALFDKKEEAIGKYININNIPFKVVGIFEDKNERDNRRIYIPISTAQKVFNGNNRIRNLAFTTKNVSPKQSKKLEEKVREQFASRHKFDKEDKSAIYINNNIDNFRQANNLFTGISIFIWIIGIGTIIAGIVGVSNIMIIVVKERTKEIGIRKAIGATPNSIIFQILSEAILITGIAGYVGLVLGVGLLELISTNLKGTDFFLNPQVDFRIAISATLLLIFSGALAGFFPAKRASKIKPIIALRDE
ncbi:MAG: ABC transporter permease [Bacteroidetes bacterium]|nr:ABC transporter permease [Bacteroidota bacterium]